MSGIPGPSLWGCTNEHFATRELGPYCPLCGSYLKYPQETPKYIYPTEVVSDGAIPETSKSAIERERRVPIMEGEPDRNINDLPFPTESTDDDSSEHSESDSESSISAIRDEEMRAQYDALSKYDLAECENGHLFYDIDADGSCYFCKEENAGIHSMSSE